MGNTSKLQRLGILLIVLTVVLIVGYVHLIFGAAGLARDKFYEKIELYTTAMTVIQREYVDKVDIQELIYGSLQGMLSSLDPHSQFMRPDEYKEIQVETTGEFGGLGIEITIRDNLLTIISPIEGTPAHEAGLQAGDRIVAIDGESTKDITLFEAVKKLRGQPGTKVTVTIMREKTKKIFDVTITRAIIKVESVRQARIVDDQIGYIRLATFGEKSAQDLEQALDKLEGEGMQALILDLRNNAGGLLNTSIEVADKFLGKDKLIVTTRGRREDQIMEFKASDENTHPDYPLVVLVNHGTASASEIVAGAIQDNKRGVLLGTRTFGKGSVQTIIPLPDGSALRLTTAKYFTPSGRSIHDEGIEPDVKVEYEPIDTKKKEEFPDSIFEKIEKHKLMKDNNDENPTSFDSSEEELEEDQTSIELYDNQVRAAINVLKGILAYRKLEVNQ